MKNAGFTRVNSKRLGLGTLLAIIVTVGTVHATSNQPAASARTSELDWVLVYIMSYDNNLASIGPIILDDLERGVTNDKTRVLVLQDDTDQDGLKRWVISANGRDHDLLETDNIASEAVVAEYLGWVAKEHPAKHYAVVFLNHGGALDEMCRDDWRDSRDKQPDPPVIDRSARTTTIHLPQSYWLSAQKMGPVMRDFRKQAAGEVELLFLQQCGRGSIDNLYNFRKAANAIMASQVNVGAPNTYYTETVQMLCDRPDTSAVELARKIMQTDEHYEHYACVDGARLADLPVQLDPVIDSILTDQSPRLSGLRHCFGTFTGKTNYDLIGWLNRAADSVGLEGSARQPIDTFATWVKGELMLAMSSGPQMSGQRAYCGVSMYVPVAERTRQRYRDYPLRVDSRLGELWDAMYPPPISD